MADENLNQLMAQLLNELAAASSARNEALQRFKDAAELYGARAHAIEKVMLDRIEPYRASDWAEEIERSQAKSATPRKTSARPTSA